MYSRLQTKLSNEARVTFIFLESSATPASVEKTKEAVALRPSLSKAADDNVDGDGCRIRWMEEE